MSRFGNYVIERRQRRHEAKHVSSQNVSKNADANVNKSETEHETSNSENAIPLAPVVVQPTSVDQYHTTDSKQASDNKKSTAEKFRALSIETKAALLATILLVIANFALVTISTIQSSILSKQASVMQRQAESMDEQLQAIKQQGVIMGQSLNAQTRPGIAVDGNPMVVHLSRVSTDGIEGRIRLVIKNFGSGPAFNVVVRTNLIVVPISDDLSNFSKDADAVCILADIGSKPIAPGDQGSGMYIFPNNSFPALFDVTGSSSNIALTASLRLVGCIAYTDQFNQTHHTRFFFYSAGPVTTILDGQGLIPSPINQRAD
jgi:hypothetical protein